MQTQRLFLSSKTTVHINTGQSLRVRFVKNAQFVNLQKYECNCNNRTQQETKGILHQHIMPF